MTQFERTLLKLQPYVAKWWYLPLLTVLAALDLFIMVVPMEAIIVATVMIIPARWVVLVICTTIGSALGALGLGLIVSTFGQAWAEHFFGPSMQSHTWLEVSAFLSKYGDWALGLMSFGPLPQQPAVVLVALAGMPVFFIFLSVLIGRGVKFFLFAWAATHAPKLIAKLFPIDPTILPPTDPKP